MKMMSPISAECEIVPGALVLAREYRGMSQTDLAHHSGVARQHIASLESGATIRPTSGTRDALCAALNVLPEFLALIPDSPPPADILHFRGKPRVTARSNKQLLALASVWTSYTRAVRSYVSRLPDDGFSRIDNAGTVEDVAARTRKAWGLREDAPIHSVVRVMERAGAFVGVFEGGEKGIDAYSWQAGTAHVLCNIDRGQPSRTRNSLLHEAGHLILHRGRATGDRETELEATRFASAVLLPRRAFWQEFPRSGSRLSWDRMFAMKQRWGASVQAIIMRAHDLGLIDAAQLRRAFMHISANGWRKSEPGEPEDVEQPELLPRVIESIAKSRGVSPSAIGRSLGLHLDDISSMSGVDLAEVDSASRLVVKLKTPRG